MDAPRRAVLGGLLGFVAALGLYRLAPARAATEDAKKEPSKRRPQVGDRLAFARGDRKGQPIAPADIVFGARPTIAYPYDAASGVLRDGSRLNQLLVLRLDENEYSDVAKQRAAEGVIAYSAICTHQKCTVFGWHPDDRVLICPCHETYYDPRDGARVMSGPARRRLPALPLTVADGFLTAAGALTGRVGGPKRR